MRPPIQFPKLDDEAILAARGPKESLDPRKPYAFHVEQELTASGAIEEVATVFLTNRECPFRCLMCDLWRYTLDESVAPGDILAQLDYALARLPDVAHIKLYNAGNFFDRRAIPTADLRSIAIRLHGFRTVIIENHPALCGPQVREFSDELGGDLEVAMGLEIAHPGVLAKLNKRMTVKGFTDACARLSGWGIGVRAFVLLAPPFLPREEAAHWAVESVRVAFEAGCGACTLIPTRGGNGIMEQLEERGIFDSPNLALLEEAHGRCLDLAGPGRRLFVDLWDAERLEGCGDCAQSRIHRMGRMNLSQLPEPRVACKCSVGRAGEASGPVSRIRPDA